MSSAQAAFTFLSDLQASLEDGLLPPAEMRAAVSAIWQKPKAEKSPQELLHCRENIFFYHFALPKTFDRVAAFEGFAAEKARQSIRCEYFGKFSSYSRANTRRIQGHPFPKKLGVKTQEIMEKWKQPIGAFRTYEAYPDMSLSDPFPHSIVFDAKYFQDESLVKAEEALVAGVYEASYYRGLPSATAQYAPQTNWGYDFGCLLAYDASDGSHLKRAWRSVASKSLFWDDARVFVMILRGLERAS